MSSTVAIARAICAALQPFTGPAAAGKLLVRSTGPTGTLEGGACAIPITNGAIDETAVVFVKKNPAVENGDWPVTSAGVLVDVECVNGGPVGNRAGATQYRWHPSQDGIELVSVADGAGLAGGSLLTGLGTIRQVRQYKQLDRATVETFFRAQLTDYPAVALAWESTQPLGGAMGSSPGPRTARAGADVVLSRHVWMLWIVTSRLDSEPERRVESDTIRDDVIERLHQRKVARELRLSMAPGAEILGASAFSTTPTSYVDLIRIATSFAMKFQHDEEYNDWLRTRLRVQTTEQSGSRIDLPDTTIPMT